MSPVSNANGGDREAVIARSTGFNAWPALHAENDRSCDRERQSDKRHRRPVALPRGITALGAALGDKGAFVFVRR